MKKHWLVNILCTLIYLSVYFIIYFQTLVNDPNTISLKVPIIYLCFQLLILNIVISTILLTIKRFRSVYYTGDIESQISHSMLLLYKTESIKKKTQLYLYISNLYLKIGDYLQAYNCLLKINIKNLNDELLEFYYEYYSTALANLPRKNNQLNTSLEYINKALEISTFKELIINKINLLISLGKIEEAKDLFNQNKDMLLNSKPITFFNKLNKLYLLRSKTYNILHLNYCLAYYYFFTKEYDLCKDHIHKVLEYKCKKNVYLIKSKVLLNLLDSNKEITPIDLISEFNKSIKDAFKEEVVYSYINKNNSNKKSDAL